MGAHPVLAVDPPAKVLRWDRAALSVHPAPSIQGSSHPGDPVGAMPGPSSPLCVLSHTTMESARALRPGGSVCMVWPQGCGSMGWPTPGLAAPRPHHLSRDVQRAGQLGLS